MQFAQKERVGIREHRMGCHEAERLQALRHLRLLDTAPSEGFDRITRMAAQVFGLPIAAVSLTDHDRQWFKSKVGIEHSTIPRLNAPCSEVAEELSVLVIPDFLADPGYADSHLARSGVRFYAGAPLVTRDGHGLGALCVLGPEPRSITSAETAALVDLAAMVMSQIELEHAYGRIDPVSGLANRHQFLDDLQDLARAGTASRRLVVLVDIGRIDQVSELTRAHGSSAVEAVISKTARILEAKLGLGRIAYHVGPTQFAFLAPTGVAEKPYLEMLSGYIREARSSTETRFVMTPVAGVVPFMAERTNPQDVLRMAYNAAQAAHGCDGGVSLYSPSSDADHARRHTLLNDFGRAIEAPGELRLVFQPRVSLPSGRCVGVEALLRWNHPELGPISPGEFIPIVERTALAGPLTTWVIDRSLAHLAIWTGKGIAIAVSLNVTAANLEDPLFVDIFAGLLQRHGVPPTAIEIEITEGTVMGNMSGATKTLSALRSMGVRVSIDDFGTGYSSLSYLRSLPLDVVKVDQSFVRRMSSDERDRKLVQSIVG
ncbi:MAG: EAL domain-containing protein, partial [Methylobacterium sp.]